MELGARAQDQPEMRDAVAALVEPEKESASVATVAERERPALRPESRERLAEQLEPEEQQASQQGRLGELELARPPGLQLAQQEELREHLEQPAEQASVVLPPERPQAPQIRQAREHLLPVLAQQEERACVGQPWRQRLLPHAPLLPEPRRPRRPSDGREP